MQIKRFAIGIILLVFFAASHLPYLTSERIASCQAQTIQLPQVTQQQAEEYQKLTPEQQRAIQAEIAKTGGVLTTEAINALRTRPEFKGLTPEDILKGKEQLEKREKAAARKEPLLREEPRREPEKRITVEEPKERSLFDRTRQIGKYQDISLDLKPFGYEFFQEAAVKVLTEREDIPIPLKYVVGPGDEVKILMWGRMNAQYTLAVDRDGKITIPQIGPLYVAGMTFEQMSKYLIKQVEQIVGTNIDISMGATRTIPIFVLGDVRRPGSYTIGALATITDALLMACGPSNIGSMRKIELRRKDKLVTRFDLYDLFLKGDKSRDMVLQAGDVVFVPVTGPLCGIAGNVKRPAIYELRDKFDLQHLFDLAGGVIPSAYTQQIQVERIVRNEKQVVVDINDKTLARARHFVIQDMDLIKVFSIVDIDENAVYLSGNVKRPGKYAFTPGMRVKDLVKEPDDLQKETYFDYALIKRQSPPSREIVLIPFNLGKLILQDDDAYNFELTPKDHVYVFHQSFFQEKPFVTVEGEIRGGSDFETGKKETTAKSDKEILEEFKTKKETTARSDREILLELKTMRDDLSNDPRYYLFVAKIRGIEEEIAKEGRPVVGDLRYLQDELEKVGRLDLTEKLKEIEEKMQVRCRLELSGNMKIKDAILGAGGLTNNAYLEEGEIVRKDMKKEYTTLYFHVAKALSEDPRENLLLQDGDRIIIHSIWENVPKKSVFIDGNVTNPGAYQYTEKMTVRDLVFKAGNVLESAYLDEAEIASMEIVSGKMGKLVYKNINLRKALEGDPLNNPVLKPYDRLFVKGITDFQAVRFANMTGEIAFAGRYPIKKGEKLSSLIERAGGYLKTAYLRGAYFTRERVRELQQKSLEEMTSRMERELLSEGAAQISAALSQEEIAAKKVEIEQKQKFIETLRKMKATGRMTIRLTDLKILKGSEYDFELEDGDTLNIPEKNSVVNVAGAVMTQSSHLYSNKLGYEDYIEATGGYSRYADKANVFVIKIDGSARKISKKFIAWNPFRSRWEMTAFGGEIRQIEPGDCIVVPEKTERIAWLREIRDITQLLMNIAVVAGVAVNLY